MGVSLEEIDNTSVFRMFAQLLKRSSKGKSTDHTNSLVRNVPSTSIMSMSSAQARFVNRRAMGHSGYGFIPECYS